MIRIPASETLRHQIASDAVRKAREAEETDEEASGPRAPSTDAMEAYVAPPPSANEEEFLQAAAIGDAHPDQPVVDGAQRPLNTASSWQMPTDGQRYVSYSSPQQH